MTTTTTSTATDFFLPSSLRRVSPPIPTHPDESLVQSLFLLLHLAKKYWGFVWSDLAVISTVCQLPFLLGVHKTRAKSEATDGHPSSFLLVSTATGNHLCVPLAGPANQTSILTLSSCRLRPLTILSSPLVFSNLSFLIVSLAQPPSSPHHHALLACQGADSPRDHLPSLALSALLLIPAAFVSWTTSTDDAVVESENADHVASAHCAGGRILPRQRRASGQTKDLFPSRGQEGIHQCHRHHLLFSPGTLERRRHHRWRLYQPRPILVRPFRKSDQER